MVTYPDEFAKQEAVGLAKAAGYLVAHKVTQKYLNHAEYGVGSGKAEELKEIANQIGCATRVQSPHYDLRRCSTEYYSVVQYLSASRDMNLGVREII
ncbi:MAG: hypothetical protein HXX80_00240 [Nitrososphaerales archaeon]|nr:hypothetical protein [Nitrososphaerales archaeon]